jgi:chromosomal replication initiation ATPase DnaA
MKYKIKSIAGLTEKFKRAYLDGKIKETGIIKNLKKIDLDKHLIYIHGERGHGKSFGVQAYAVHLRSKYNKLKIKYISMSKLIMILYSKSIENRVAFIEELINIYDLLIIDEVDKITLTDFKEEMIFYMLDERINRESFTILLGNAGLAELEKRLKQNIMSRISTGLIMPYNDEVLR